MPARGTSADPTLELPSQSPYAGHYNSESMADVMDFAAYEHTSPESTTNDTPFTREDAKRATDVLLSYFPEGSSQYYAAMSVAVGLGGGGPSNMESEARC